MTIDSIKKNLKEIRRQIKLSCSKTNRGFDEIKLEVVTKGVPPEIIKEIPKLGLNLFGENRIRQTQINRNYFSSENEIHMIGHLDTNDASKAVELYDAIESLDSMRLAEKLNYQARQRHKVMPVFLQLKTDLQLTKHGFVKEEIIDAAARITLMPHLKIFGLMTLPPLADDPENSRPYFQKLRTTAEEIERALRAPLPYLSMGTSQDFTIAIEEGANIIRLGRSVFGFPFPYETTSTFVKKQTRRN